MESLAEETWDVVVAGTGLVQALLALSLSRSNLKILHVDASTYYGGVDAGLSLDEAKSWAERYYDGTETFSSARISSPTLATSTQLKGSRAYTLSLNPQIVYAQSTFLPSLVSSNVNTQLEFMAVGSWWIYKQGKLQKVPSTREDVFADDTLSRRDKVGLMKFLRHVVQDGELSEIEQESASVEEDQQSLASSLSSKFKISPDLQLPISALALIPQSVHNTPVRDAVSRMRRHMRSMGYFGPGFGAVVAKYAGNAEIAQVCCRACAVGGATYLLGQGVSGVVADKEEEDVEVTLTGGITVKSKILVSSLDDLPSQSINTVPARIPQSTQMCRSISIVSAPLRHLFPATSDNGPVPAATIVLSADTEDIDEALKTPPLYLQVHSEDTGECPTGQCIIYASTLLPENVDVTSTYQRLTLAVQKLIGVLPQETSTSQNALPNPPEILWSMSYVSTGTSPSTAPSEVFMQDNSGRVLICPPPVQDIAFDDSILKTVEATWKKILGSAADELEFLRFEDRSGNMDADEQ